MTGVDALKNAAKEVEGKAKETAGHAAGRPELEIDGQIDRATATARKNGEDEDDLFGDGNRS